MPTEPEDNLRFQFGHVLFIDLVGYSRLLIEEQKERLSQLNEIVLATAQVREAPDEQLVRLPTGDGMALVFRNSSEEPARCALEIAQALKKHPEIPVRMGIHSGPVSEVTDVSGRTNLAGAGINLAQRVMDCGDAGHILLSQRVAEDLAQYRQWAPRLHDLGECEVKHGVRLHLVNLYAEQLGNPAPPEKFKKSRTSTPTTKSKPGRLILALVLLIFLGIPALIFTPAILKSWRSKSEPASTPPPATSPAVPEKSIAVLPFENLSSDKENAYFADGVQDEILTNLARIADLKVISRTSVMQYKDVASRKLPEIAATLKVAHVLEGTVQRAANRVRVNAQLIDARTDTHLWAQTYDRDLADVFAIQSEIAKTIAHHLQATLSPREAADLKAPPTRDLVAYDLYLRAREINRQSVSAIGVGGVEATRRLIPLLEAAVRRDPGFVQALCQLAHGHLFIYWQGDDHTSARLEAAAKLLDQAARAQPDAGEIHLERAYLLYWGKRDYDGALGELALAGKVLPNDARIPYLAGLINRRQGKWDEAIRLLEQAVTADPRNTFMISETAGTYHVVRRYREAARVVADALAWNPINFGLNQLNAYIAEDWKADLGPWHDLITSAAGKAASPAELANTRFDLAMLERDYSTAAQILAEGRVAEFDNNGFFAPREWHEAIIARALGEDATAQAKFLGAHERAAAKVTAQPEDARALIVLAQISAALSRKADAMTEGEHASELLPIAKDSINGAEIACRLAGIYAEVGETDRAFDSLRKVVRIPFGASYGALKLDRAWDPLRGDPRFETLVQSLAPQAD